VFPQKWSSILRRGLDVATLLGGKLDECPVRLLIRNYWKGGTVLVPVRIFIGFPLGNYWLPTSHLARIFIGFPLENYWPPTWYVFLLASHLEMFLPI